MGIAKFRRTLIGTVAIISILAGGALGAPIVKPLNNPVTLAPGAPVGDVIGATLDLNDDGISDVSFLHATAFATGHHLAASENLISGLNGAMILVTGNQIAGYPVDVAKAFKPGEFVATGGQFAQAAKVIDTWTSPIGYSPPAQWNPDFLDSDVAVGVLIPAGGQNYFAWVGVQSLNNNAGAENNTLLLHDYGYESTPNVPVAAEAPEPASLALIGLAAASLLARRRR